MLGHKKIQLLSPSSSPPSLSLYLCLFLSLFLSLPHVPFSIVTIFFSGSLQHVYLFHSIIVSLIFPLSLTMIPPFRSSVSNILSFFLKKNTISFLPFLPQYCIFPHFPHTPLYLFTLCIGADGQRYFVQMNKGKLLISMF